MGNKNESKQKTRICVEIPKDIDGIRLVKKTREYAHLRTSGVIRSFIEVSHI